MNINKLFPSKYLKSDDFDQGERTMTMSHVDVESMQQSGEEKPCLYFIEEERGMVLNRTNAATIEGLYGGETSAWDGKPIAVYRATTNFSGRRVPCIRVKAPAGAPPAAPSPQPAAAPIPDVATGNAELDAIADPANIPFG